MVYRLLADFVVVAHGAFILFVVLGSLLVFRWRWMAWVHLPAAAWGAAVEFFGWFCPLTHLEQFLRHASGAAGYSGGFIEHYLIPIIYPAGLTREVQLLLGCAVVAVNLFAYLTIWRRIWRHEGAAGQVYSD